MKVSLSSKSNDQMKPIMLYIIKFLIRIVNHDMYYYAENFVTLRPKIIEQ